MGKGHMQSAVSGEPPESFGQATSLLVGGREVTSDGGAGDACGAPQGSVRVDPWS